MASNNSHAAGGGIGFAGALALLFIGLKLGHAITWSWWWVLSPLWGGLALSIAAIGLLLAFAGIASAVNPKSRRRY
jgi:hypothetical protein